MADNKSKTTTLPVSNSLLPPETASSFELVDWKGGAKQVFGIYGTVDVSTLTPAQASRLVMRGFKKIKRK